MGVHQGAKKTITHMWVARTEKRIYIYSDIISNHHEAY